MPGAPFQIFPWRKPFPPDLKTYLQSISSNGLGIIIVPHQRPWRYFREIYAREGKPGLLPTVLTFAQVVAIWRANHHAPAAGFANSLDQVALLRQCILDVAKNDEGLARRFGEMEMEHFLPWGFRLGKLLDEMLIEGLAGEDLPYLEYSVAKPAEELLGALGRIATAWRGLLLSRKLTTRGLDHYIAAQHAADIPATLMPSAKRPVLIAGFHTLNGTQEKLFRSLWEAGAKICLHTDAEILKGDNFHWSCNPHAAWIKKWRARAEQALPNDATPDPRQPKMSFFAGYDCHSQLAEMATLLEGDNDPGPSTAIVLTHPDLLPPTLHHMPNKNINISLGYPLRRTPFGVLVEDLFSLQAGISKEGHYYWRDLLKIINQPYIKMLMADEPASNSLFRECLRELDGKIRTGLKYVDIQSLPDNLDEKFEPVKPLVREVFESFLTKFGNIGTPADLANTLEGICLFLLRKAPIQESYPLDAEAISRYLSIVVPCLRNNELANEVFSIPGLHDILTQLTGDERVAFEADPIVGIQILGMLETRLLHFERVIFLDASDDILPGNAAQDPLLPDSLRGLLGLPDKRDREAAVAYNIHRLCAGAKDVRFYWQEGSQHSTLFDSKKSRSRFVEQFIWEEEKKRGQELKPDGDMLKLAKAAIPPLEPRSPEIWASPKIRLAVDRFLSGGISASSLNDFLGCPMRFAMARLLRIGEAPEVNEGEDASLTGTFIHNVLARLYEPWKGKIIADPALLLPGLQTCFDEVASEMDLANLMPLDSRILLETVGPQKLARFIASQPPTWIQELEKDVKARVILNNRAYRFIGRVDRVDKRDDGFHLLDYKTGNFPKYEKDLWAEEEYFDRLENWCQAPESGEIESLLAEFRQKVSNLQMPVYQGILAPGYWDPVANSAFVDLKKTGREVPIFEDASPQTINQAMLNFRKAIGFILESMRHLPKFAPEPSGNCQYCAYLDICQPQK